MPKASPVADLEKRLEKELASLGKLEENLQTEAEQRKAAIAQLQAQLSEAKTAAEAAEAEARVSQQIKALRKLGDEINPHLRRF